MTKAVSLLKNKPNIKEEKREDINRFIHLSLLTFGYAPDRHDVSEFGIYPEKDDSYINIASSIVPILHEKFFCELYTDRPERKKLRAIFLQGD